MKSSLPSQRLYARHSGATNPTRHSMTLGNVDNGRFTVVCSGDELLILGSNLEKLQVLREDGITKFVAVDSCRSDGKICAIGGNDDGDTSAFVYRPSKAKGLETGHSAFGYTWEHVATLPTASQATCVSWNPLGDRLVIGGDHLTMWGHKAVLDPTENAPSEQSEFASQLEDDFPYAVSSSRRMPSTLEFLSYSPDGRVFASAAKHDRIIKIWYSVHHELVKESHTHSTSFVYLEHPKPVTAFSWRKVSDQKMHKYFVKNVLVSSCQDLVCRIWAETEAHEPLGFYLATVIDPAAYTGLESIADSFTLHWLNTKDLRYKVLTDTKKMKSSSPSLELVDTLADRIHADEVDGDKGRDDDDDADGDDNDIDNDFVLVDESLINRSSPPRETNYDDGMTLLTCHQQTPYKRGTMPSHRAPQSDADNNWPDVLFYVGTDGSLIFWSVSLLDESPRRDPDVKNISRTMEKIVPPADAVGIAGNVVVFLDNDASSWKRCLPDEAADGDNFTYLSRKSLSMAIVMHHTSGDVTKWCAAFADNSSFADVLSVDEGPRCTGHFGDITLALNHPLCDKVLTVGRHNDTTEAMVWKVRRDSCITDYERLLEDPIAYRFTSKSTESTNKFCWIPHKDIIALVHSSKDGICIVSVADSDAPVEVTANTTSFRKYHGWDSIWCQIGSARRNYTTSVWVYGLHSSGLELSVWHVLLGTKFDPTSGKSILTAKVSLALDSKSICNLSPDLVFLNTSRICTLDTDESNDKCLYAMLGVTTSDGLALWECFCDEKYGADGVNMEAPKATAVLIDTGNFSDPVSNSFSMVSVSSTGRVAFADRDQNEIAIFGFGVTGVGLRELSRFSVSGQINSICWGASTTWQHVLYVLTSNSVHIFAPNIPNGIIGSDMYKEISRTQTIGDVSSKSIICSTHATMTLITSGKEIHVQSSWVSPQHLEEDDDEFEDIDSTIRPMDSLLLNAYGDVPQYNPEHLIQCFMWGQNQRAALIIKNLATAFKRFEEIGNIEKPDGFAEIPSLAFDEMWNTPPENVESSDLFETRLGVEGNNNNLSKDAEYVCEHLATMQLPGLTRMEQVATLAVLESASEIELNSMSLDECGIRFFVPLLQKTCLQKNRNLRPTLNPSSFVWAMLSEAQERLLELCPGVGQKPGFTWEDLRAVGGGYWIQNNQTLKLYIEKIAKNTFNVTKQPLDAALWYLAMKKKNVLWGLFKSVQDQRMSDFFGHNFSEQRWYTAAQNNAFKLLSMQRYYHAIAFFLLGNALEEAAQVCIQNLKDPQLAIVIIRLYSNGEDCPELDKILKRQSEDSDDPFIDCISHWLQKDYSGSLGSLLKYGVGDCGSDAHSRRDFLVSNAPTMLNLCKVLQKNMQVKQHCAKIAGRDKLLTIVPTALFFGAYESYRRRGLPLFALDVLANYCEALEEINKDGTDGDIIVQTAPTTLTVAKPAAAIDSGMIDFGSFGGFMDEFSQFDTPEVQSATSEETSKTETPEQPYEGLTEPAWMLQNQFIQPLKWNCCVVLVIQAALSDNSYGWTKMKMGFSRQAAAVAQICAMNEDETLSALQQECLAAAKRLDDPVVLLKLKVISGSSNVSDVLDDLSSELLKLIRRSVQTYAKTKKSYTLVGGAMANHSILRRIDQIIRQIDSCLYQIFYNLWRGENLKCPSDIKLTEYVSIVYTALILSAFKGKDAGRMVELLKNKPGPSFWTHLCPEANTANDVVTTLTTRSQSPQSTETSVDVASMLSYFHRKVDPKDFADVDIGANWADDGSKVIIVDHDTGSPEARHEQFRWFLTDFIAAKFAIWVLRDLIKSTIDIKIVDLDKASSKLHRTVESLEEFTAVAELKLFALPSVISETSPTSSVRGSHSVHGLFKMRRLLDVKSNIFQSIDSRRLWHFLVQHDHLHKSIEFHMFERQSQVGNNAIRVGDWASVYNAGTEIYSICDISRNKSELVIGTSKGIVELTSSETDIPSRNTVGVPPYVSSRSGNSSPSFDIPGSDSRPVSPSTLVGSIDNLETEEHYIAGLTRPIPGGVRALATHPTMPCYVSGSSHGLLQLWHYNQTHPLSTFRTDTSCKVNGLRFSSYGNKFGAVNSAGDLMLWRFLSGDESDDPFLSIKVNSKRTDDFSFLKSTSLIATGGLSTDGCNVNLWDTLLMSTNRFSLAHPIRSFEINDGGTRAMGYSAASQRLICGSHKGEIAVVDFRQQAVIKTWFAHEGSVNRLIINEEHDTILTAASSGDVKLWSLNSLRQIANYDGLHARSTFFKSGVVDMLLQDKSLLTCGIDGYVKLSAPW